MRIVSLIVVAIVFLCAGKDAWAAVRTSAVEYEHEGVKLQGYLAYDDARQGQSPGVLIAHEWNGLADLPKRSAEKLAALGYVAFALDMYGKGVLASTPEESARLAKPFKDDRSLMRRRAAAGLEAFRRQPQVDPARIVAMGYCFGGTTVLELARSGADLRGVASFHGGLDTPSPGDARNIKCPVIAFHGADDPLVTAQDVLAFEEEMRSAGADWQLVMFGGAVHSFTNPAHGTDPSKGVAYNRKADNRSWDYFLVFLREACG